MSERLDPFNDEPQKSSFDVQKVEEIIRLPDDDYQTILQAKIVLDRCIERLTTVITESPLESMLDAIVLLEVTTLGELFAVALGVCDTLIDVHDSENMEEFVKRALTEAQQQATMRSAVFDRDNLPA